MSVSPKSVAVLAQEIAVKDVDVDRFVQFALSDTLARNGIIHQRSMAETIAFFSLPVTILPVLYSQSLRQHGYNFNHREQ